jgi:hypothetical protein
VEDLGTVAARIVAKLSLEHPMNLKRGTKFEHRFWLADCSAKDTPLLCLVTKIRQGILYYRPIFDTNDGTPSLGAPACFPLTDATRYVGRIF